ncbi:hypothetical protein [Nesterenkonia sp. CF4.4]|uniref:hypothetical protein n=1 Tax=Nesterenkonia sp. CF4.4 TaxID=3373079 RepID=UPI003EE606B0
MGVENPGDQSTSAPAATSPAEDPTPDDLNTDDLNTDGSNLDGDSADGGGAGADGAGRDVAPDMIPTPVQETQELVTEYLSSWQEYSTSSEMELQLAFYSGNPACYGVRSVVEEDDDEVRVATISGTLPDAVGSACTQEARYVSVVIELQEPLGEREVVPLTEVDLAR